MNSTIDASAISLDEPQLELEPPLAEQATVFTTAHTVLNDVRDFLGRVAHQMRRGVTWVATRIGNLNYRVHLWARIVEASIIRWVDHHPRTKFLLTWFGFAVGLGIFVAVYLIIFMIIWIGFMMLLGLAV